MSRQMPVSSTPRPSSFVVPNEHSRSELNPNAWGTTFSEWNVPGFSDDEIETILSLSLPPPPPMCGPVVTVSTDGQTVKIDEKWMLPDFVYPFEFQDELFHAVRESETGNVVVYEVNVEAA